MSITEMCINAAVNTIRLIVSDMDRYDEANANAAMAIVVRELDQLTK